MSTASVPQQYCIFPTESDNDFAKLREERDKLMRTPKAKNTLKAYSSSWAAFVDWCAEWQRDPLPAHSDILQEFVTWARKIRKSPYALPSIDLALSAIRYYHKQAGLPSPVDEAVRDVMANLRRENAQDGERPERAGKKNLTPEQLRKICRALSGSSDGICIRDRAIVLFGFATALRREEIHHLMTDHVSFEPDFLRLWVRYSKTDQLGKGRVLKIPFGRSDLTCPVRALQAWRAYRMRECGRFSGPLFTQFKPRDLNVFTDKSLGGAGIAGVLKRAIGRIGENPADYAAHSMRSGMITAALANGQTYRDVMDRSGHVRVETMMRYAKSNPKVNVLANVL